MAVTNKPKKTGRLPAEDEVKERVDYCSCDHSSSVYSVNGEWGYHLCCSDCNKMIEDSFKYYNHYDGKDHCD